MRATDRRQKNEYQDMQQIRAPVGDYYYSQMMIQNTHNNHTSQKDKTTSPALQQHT